MQNKRSQHTKKLVEMAILVAVMLVLNYTPLGFLKIGAIEITFMCIPIAVGAVMLGPIGGAILGTLFGVFSFIQCFGASAFGVFLLSLSPVLTAVVCIVPRMLCGLLAGLLFRLLSKVDRTRVVSYFAASLATALLNTLFFMASIIIFFWSDNAFLAQMMAWELPTDNIWAFFLAFVGLNGLVEAIVAFFVGGGIAKALGRYVLRQEEMDFVPPTPAREETPILEDTPVSVSEEAVPVAEPQQTPVVTPVAETPAPIAEETDDENDDEGAPVSLSLGGRQFTVRYRKSFLAKLILAKDSTKEYYAALATELSAYSGVRGRESWDYQSFNKGREQVAKLAVRGKTLCLYLALDPNALADTKYNVEEAGAKKFAKVPTLFRVRSDRALKWAKELIAMAMEAVEATYDVPTVTLTAADYPTETLAALIARGLVKYLVTAEDGADVPELSADEVTTLIRTQVSVTEAHDLMDDSTAEALTETERITTSGGRKFAVNIDTLAKHFTDGDTVTIETLIARGLVPKKETAVKILARGVLDKALYVHADDFSADAVKMILLTGGKVYKRKK